ncbi:DUF4150 domain-containing protein [Salmonella enterica]|nr:DUF4150 domain-containing protein [Salmonella enterica]
MCKTPPFGVPVAYENEAYSSDLVKGTTSVFADGGNMIANMGSQCTRRSGEHGGRDIGDEQSGNRVDIAFVRCVF